MPRWILVVAFMVLPVLSLAGTQTIDCPRIVSQSPYLTQSLVWLGRADCIVGVSRYDTLRRPKTGGVMDPDPAAIQAEMDRISASREASQPLRSKTGGSTFKNPDGGKAWELVDKAGCRGLTLGGAQVSEKHTNFLINTGDATSTDIEALGEEVRRRVQDMSGVELEWEIQRVGRSQ